jgi:hypothetical protein
MHNGKEGRPPSCGHIAHNVRMWSVHGTEPFAVLGGEAA